MKAVSFRFHELGRYSAFVRKLSEAPESLVALGYVRPEKAAFEKRIRFLEENFNPEQRFRLRAQLNKQQSNLAWSEAQLQHLDWLSDSKTFVVSTAHQPSFLGGPAYIPVKIASSIALCRQLSEWFPTYRFVPVHWLGSEDHDFDELGKTQFLGQLMQWNAQAGGPVGRIALGDWEESRNQIEASLLHKPFGSWALATLKQAFLSEYTLAQAMRVWLNELFSKEGLLVIDGDDAVLKQQFVPFMQREFRESMALPELQRGAHRFIDAGLEPPLFGREINLFHLTHERRDRLEPLSDGRWKTKSGSLTLSREEGAQFVAETPLAWSPNAVLRPLYQEVILPEVAFVGGGAEIAYWTQLQETFTKAGLQQPLLVLRSSLGWVESSVWKKAERAGFEEAWLGRKFQSWEEEVLKVSGLEAQLSIMEEVAGRMQAAYQQISGLVQEVDPTLTGAAEAERQKAMNGLEGLKAKLKKAHKQKQEVQLRQLKALYDKLFPNDKLQEREESIVPALAQWGPDWIALLIRHLNPIETEFLLLVDEQ